MPAKVFRVLVMSCFITQNFKGLGTRAGDRAGPDLVRNRFKIAGNLARVGFVQKPVPQPDCKGGTRAGIRNTPKRAGRELVIIFVNVQRATVGGGVFRPRLIKCHNEKNLRTGTQEPGKGSPDIVRGFIPYFVKWLPLSNPQRLWTVKRSPGLIPTTRERSCFVLAVVSPCTAPRVCAFFVQPL